MAELTVANSKLTMDNPHSAGDHWIITGTLIPGDTNANYFKAGRHVLYCNVVNENDDDTMMAVKINASDLSTTAEGSITFQGTVADTYRYSAGVLF